MRVRIVIKQTQTVITDIGDIPPNLLKDLLIDHDGTFDGNWAPHDLKGAQTWETDEVLVEEVKGK